MFNVTEMLADAIGIATGINTSNGKIGTKVKTFGDNLQSKAVNAVNAKRDEIRATLAADDDIDVSQLSATELAEAGIGATDQAKFF